MINIFNKIRSRINNKFCPFKQFEVISYAQEGEDIILQRYFSNKKKGVYVDIGAHHPIRFSNTYIFYKSGWTGINIDPIPGVKAIFDQVRPKDINLELAINNEETEIEYYNFREKALNTFSKTLAKQYTDANWKLESVLKLNTTPLYKVLDNFFPVPQNIDFMSIDVEGFEFNVLSSNNWEKYKPKIILIELLNCTIDQYPHTEIAKFLTPKGYSVFAKTFNTFFLKLDDL